MVTGASPLDLTMNFTEISQILSQTNLDWKTILLNSPNHEFYSEQLPAVQALIGPTDLVHQELYDVIRDYRAEETYFYIYTYFLKDHNLYLGFKVQKEEYRVLTPVWSRPSFFEMEPTSGCKLQG